MIDDLSLLTFAPHPWLVALQLGALALFTLYVYLSLTQAEGGPAPAVRGLLGPAGLIALMGAVLFSFRLPVLFLDAEMNHDESVYLAQAMAYLEDPVAWRSFDSGTAGPLISMFFGLLARAGFPLGFLTAHAAAFALTWGTLALTYLTLRTLHSESAARMAVFLETVGFYFVIMYGEHVHFASELLPVFMMAASAYVLSVYWRAGGRGPIYLVLGGILIGAAPLAKLQAGPLAAFLGMVYVAAIYFHERRSGGRWARQVLVFCVSCLAVPTVVLTPVALGGAFDEFWYSYILSNLVYSGEPFDPAGIAWLLLGNADFTIYLMVSAVVFALALALGLRRGRAPQGLGLGLLPGAYMAYLAVALYTVLKPGSPFRHYHFFLMHPITMAVAWALDRALGDPVESRPGWRNAKRWQAAVLALVLLVQAARVASPFGANPYLFGQMIATWAWGPAKRELWKGVEVVRLFARPGEGMAIWGTFPSYYVEAEMVPVVRDSTILQYYLAGGPLQPRFLARWIGDMAAKMPPVFVDAIAKGSYFYEDRTRFGHEQFPGLRELVGENYTLVCTLGADLETGVRIYARNDRAARFMRERAARTGEARQ